MPYEADVVLVLNDKFEEKNRSGEAGVDLEFTKMYDYLRSRSGRLHGSGSGDDDHVTIE